MDTHDPLARAKAKPNVDDLARELDNIGSVRQLFPTVADNTRFCRWPNQSADGKKRDKGKVPAFPWNGASDTKPMTADRVIVDNVAVLKEAFWRASSRQKAADDEVGVYSTKLVDYFVNERMTTQLIREVELSAQYRETYGWFALHPTWEQKISLRRKTITLQELELFVTQLQATDPNVPDFSMLAQTIMEPELEDVAMKMLGELYDLFSRAQLTAQFEAVIPKASQSKIRRSVRELRESQETTIALPYVSKDGPSILALKPFDEIFIPHDTTDVENARVIFQREFVTEATLVERINTDGYSSKWVDIVKKFKGSSSIGDLPVGTPGTAISNPNTNTTDTTGDDGRSNYIEIFHCCSKQVDEDGVAAIYLTTIHAKAIKDDDGKPIWAKHELLDYPHGEYPHVFGCREFHCRRITSSRGVPEIIHTRQNEKKALLDAVIDRTSITVMPPINLVSGVLGGKKYQFGPAVQNTIIQGKEPRFMEMPSGQGISEGFATVERIDFEIDNYFGIMSQKVPAARTQLLQSSMVSGFLVAWTQALCHLVSLAQKYMSAEEFSRITGAPAGWLENYRDKIGSLRVMLSFDVRELDPELTGKQIEAVTKIVLPTDVGGVINRNKMVEVMMRTINPTWAKETVLPSQAASQQMFESVRTEIAQMYLGNEPRYVQNDPAAATKMQFAQQIISSNPNYLEALKSQTRFAELLSKWTDSLKFSLTQDRNKEIGRIGVVPGETNES